MRKSGGRIVGDVGARKGSQRVYRVLSKVWCSRIVGPLDGDLRRDMRGQGTGPQRLHSSIQCDATSHFARARAIALALEAPDVWFGLIVDGFHVDPVILRIALRGLGPPILVTDAMPPVGGSRPSFNLYGHGIQALGGRCLRADGSLAGTVLDMASAIRNCVSLLQVPLEDALGFASRNPAEFIGVWKQARQTRRRVSRRYGSNRSRNDFRLGNVGRGAKEFSGEAAPEYGFLTAQ